MAKPEAIPSFEPEAASGIIAKDPQSAPLIGAELDGRYRVMSVIGRGGVGVVYRGEHVALERPVAIKVLNAALAGDASVRQRFELEAKTLSALAHPHIVPLADYGVAEGMPYLVMEHLEGESMDVRIARQGSFPVEEALRLIAQVLRGLAFAHARQVTHRDLKPANIFLQQLEGQGVHVRLLDFGLAKIVANAQLSRGLTAAGMVMGTPGYMAPEQAAGEEVTPAADVYACGVVLFEMIAGRMPFSDRSQTELLRAHLVQPVPRFAELRPDLDVPEAVEALVQRAMAKSRTDRFASAAEFLAAVEVCAETALGLSLSARATPEQGVGFAATDLAMTPVSAATPAAFETAPTRAAGVPSLKRRPAYLVPAAIAGLFACALAFWLWRGATERELPLEATAALPAATELPAAAAQPEKANTEAPLWAQGFKTPTPEALRPFEAALEAGRDLDRKSMRQLRSLRRVYAEDPRPALLLGHHFFQKRWFKDALDWYATALELNPEARRDRRVMDNSLAMVMQSPSYAARASETLQSYFGASALPAVEAKIQAQLDNPVVVGRLVELKARLGETPAP